MTCQCKLKIEQRSESKALKSNNLFGEKIPYRQAAMVAYIHWKSSISTNVHSYSIYDTSEIRSSILNPDIFILMHVSKENTSETSHVIRLTRSDCFFPFSSKHGMRHLKVRRFPTHKGILNIIPWRSCRLCEYFYIMQWRALPHRSAFHYAFSRTHQSEITHRSFVLSIE